MQPPRTIQVSKERLQEVVAAAFPVRRRIAEFIEISIGAPIVSLQAERGRIAVDLAVAAAGLPSAPGVAGTLRVSHALRYEPSDRSVRAVDVVVERFELDGLPTSLQQRLDRFGRPLASALLEDRVLYALQPRELAALDRGGVQVVAIRVTPAGIEIELAPIR